MAGVHWPNDWMTEWLTRSVQTVDLYTYRRRVLRQQAEEDHGALADIYTAAWNAARDRFGSEIAESPSMLALCCCSCRRLHAAVKRYKERAINIIMCLTLTTISVTKLRHDRLSHRWFCINETRLLVSVHPYVHPYVHGTRITIDGH